MNKPDTCPGYSADIDTEYNRVTENGTRCADRAIASSMKTPTGMVNAITTMSPKTISTFATAPSTAGTGCQKRYRTMRRKSSPCWRRGAEKTARRLSRRELFAAVAIQGIMASNENGIGHIPQNAAKWAVSVADALCKELDAPIE